MAIVAIHLAVRMRGKLSNVAKEESVCCVLCKVYGVAVWAICEVSLVVRWVVSSSVGRTVPALSILTAKSSKADMCSDSMVFVDDSVCEICN